MSDNPAPMTHDSAVSLARSNPRCARAAPESAKDVFYEAQPSGEFFPDFFCFSIGGSLYTISSDGVGTRINARNERERFALRVEKNFDVNLVIYRTIGNRLYLMYQTTDSEYGGGYLDAFEISTLRPLWLTPASISANLGNPLLVDSAAYVTGMGVVGKVRLSDGKFFWKHIFGGEGLEKIPPPQQYLTAFDVPQRANGTVRFPQDTTVSPGGVTFVIDDASGVIVSPDILKGQKPLCTGNQPLC